MCLKGLKLLAFLLILSGNVWAFQLKRAATLIDKGNLSQAAEIVDRAIAKDFNNPGAKYLYSLLYLHPQFSSFSIDSAHYYIDLAREEITTLDVKEVERLSKIGIASQQLEEQKIEVDEAAFIHAKNTNTEKALNFFIADYADASHVDEAILIRNHLAFQRTTAIDTYQAYKEFLATYPQSQQAAVAKDRYDQRLYQEKTKAQDLASYRSFLAEHPDSPFRAVVESKIFTLITAYNTQKGYYDFIEAYPNSPLKEEAFDFLYHMAEEVDSTTAFIATLPKGQYKDSLNNVDALNKELWFMEAKGGLTLLNSNLPKNFQLMADSLLCHGLRDDFISGFLENKRVILSRDGSLIFNNPFVTTSDLGFGFIRYQSNEQFGLVHKSGKEVLPPEYTDLGLLSGRLIKFKRFNGWGLQNLAEQVVLKDEYDDIYELGDFVVLEKKGTIAITSLADLIALDLKVAPSFDLLYDEVELLDDGNLLCFSGDKEALLSRELKLIVPLQEQEISELGNYWLVRKGAKYHLHGKGGQLLEGEIDQIKFSENFAGIKKANKWMLFPLTNGFESNYQYDSINLLNDHISIQAKSGSLMAVFEGGHQLNISSSSNITLLKATNGISEDDHLLSFDNDDVKRVYDRYGKKVLAGWFDEISVINREVFTIKEKGKFGLSDSTGQNILPIDYDGIGQAFGSNVSILEGRKFGAFNFRQKKLVEPEFDLQLRVFSDTMLIASQDGKWGIIDLEGNIILPFDFSEILPWTATKALALSAEGWQFIDLNSTDSPVDLADIEFLTRTGNDFRIKYSIQSLAGVIDNSLGDILQPVFDQISSYNLGGLSGYRALRHFKEADIYIVAFYDANGQLLHRYTTDQESYTRVLSCAAE